MIYSEGAAVVHPEYIIPAVGENFTSPCWFWLEPAIIHEPRNSQSGVTALAHFLNTILPNPYVAFHGREKFCHLYLLSCSEVPTGEERKWVDISAVT